jgi:hypothetical protein
MSMRSSFESLVRQRQPLWGGLLSMWLAACAEDDAGLSFQHDIKPIFDEKCAVCHFTGNGYADLQNVFNPDPGPYGITGLVGSTSVWNANHHYGPEFNVVPYEPDNSYVLEKMTNPELLPAACTADQCLPNEAGFFMPPAPGHLQPEQIDAVRSWIMEGADPDVFRDRIIPTTHVERGLPNGYTLLNLFGNYSNLEKPPGDPCGFVGSPQGCIQCVSCHRKDGPYHPQSVSADAWIDVTANFRTDLKLVVPGNPKDSFLLRKLEATESRSDLGSPMPYGYEPLTDTQIALVRQWIADGAKKN